MANIIDLSDLENVKISVLNDMGIPSSAGTLNQILAVNASGDLVFVDLDDILSLGDMELGNLTLTKEDSFPAEDITLKLIAGNGKSAIIELWGDKGDQNRSKIRVFAKDDGATNCNLNFANYGTGAWVNLLELSWIATGGQVVIRNVGDGAGLLIDGKVGISNAHMALRAGEAKNAVISLMVDNDDDTLDDMRLWHDTSNVFNIGWWTGTGEVYTSALTLTTTGTITVKGAILSDLTASKLVLTDASKNLISSSYGISEIALLASPSFTGTVTLGTNVGFLNTMPTTNGYWTGPHTTGTAGENVAFGDVVYYKSDGKWWKADADAVATSVDLSIALGTINADASGNFALPGCILYKTSWTDCTGIYGAAYLSCTAGQIHATAPSGNTDVVIVVGYKRSAQILLFCPGQAWVEVAA